jgi:hypothetical protein
MRLIERLPYALCRFHTRSFILDVQPRIKAPFPFQNILSRPYGSSRLAWPTEHPVGYTWLNHGFMDWVLEFGNFVITFICL